MIRHVEVPLPGRAYEILIGPGLLARAGQEIAARVGQRRLFIITDKNVAPLHLKALQESITAAGLENKALALPPGESTKSWANIEHTVEWLLAERAERDDIVVGLGGGVIGDLTGFAAAILRRGVRLVQIPTSLLAQVDSSVGGKTGINSPRGKNLIGAFHQPSLVLADSDILTSLPKRELRAGYAEVAKYGLLGDAGFFTWLEQAGPGLIDGNGEAIGQAVERCCQMKSDIVVRDETERGDRALLNLGHTFGHALEAATGYSDRLLHGEAVSIGCVLAFELSHALGQCPADVPARVRAHFAALGLRHSVTQVPGDVPDVETLINLMRQDKKVRDGNITFILAHDIGKAFVAEGVDLTPVRQVLRTALAG